MRSPTERNIRPGSSARSMRGARRSPPPRLRSLKSLFSFRIGSEALPSASSASVRAAGVAFSLGSRLDQQVFARAKGLQHFGRAFDDAVHGIFRDHELDADATFEFDIQFVEKRAAAGQVDAAVA